MVHLAGLNIIYYKMAYVKTEAYVKPENMAELNTMLNLFGVIPN